LPLDVLAVAVPVVHPWSRALDVWHEPSPLRLLAVAARPGWSPWETRWDDAAQMTERLVMTAEEIPTGAPGSGDYMLTLTYARASAPSDPVAVTVKSYTGGEVGPVARTNTHRLYREDGSYIERTDPVPKTYDGEESMRTGRARRRRHTDRLVATLRAVVVGGGGDPTATLAALLPYVDAFIETSDPGPLLAAVQASAPDLLPAVQAGLAPWVTP